MEMCINPAVLDELTKCGRAHVYSGTKYYCTISWEHVKIYGKSSGSRNCVKPTA